jgi:KaiC/GvpD/RAD55 family RecA-like ATPase
MSDETTDADDDPVDGPPTDTAVADGEPAADDASSSQSVDDDESPVGAEGASADEESITRCDYCRLPCPKDPLTVEHDGVTYHYCSESCRDTQGADEGLVTQYHGFRRYEPNVDALDAGLPQGVPRNSFVMLTDLAGTRSEAIMAELVWRALQRGEPALVVSFQEPPISIVERFLTLDWNVLPYLQNGQLEILDCLTYRLEDHERMHDRMNEWNRYLVEVVEPATTAVRDGSDVRELRNKIDTCLDDRDVSDTGVVTIDSLTELGTIVQPVQAYDFVKDLRADVCKGRFVPVFAGATYSGDAGTFPHDLEYIADGVVDFELNGELVADTLLKRTRIRKMNGVLSISEWNAYEYTAGKGMVPFDPAAEMEREDDGESRTGDEASATSTGEPTPPGAEDGSTDGPGPADPETDSTETG